MSENQKRQILITGASGFLGQYIVNQLKNKPEYELTCLYHKNGLSDLGVKMFPCDLSDIVRLEEYVKHSDVIIHAAGFVSFDRSDHKLLMQVNAEGTANLVNLALEHSIEHFIHISSIAALPSVEGESIITESNRFKDRNFTSEYGLSKYLAESHVWRAYAEGLEVSIVNPSLILGIGDWEKGSANLFSVIKSGLSYYPTGSTGVVYAGDVARFIELILCTKTEERQFILNGENVLYYDLFSWIAESVKVSKPSTPIKGMYKWLAWALDKANKYVRGKSSVLSLQNIRSFSTKKTYENDLSLSIEGFKYSPVKQQIQLIGKAFLEQYK